MSFPNDRTYTPDANSILSDNAAAYTATGFLQVGAAQAILDLGGNQGTTPKQQARIDAVALFDVTAIDISSGNETYKIMLLGSNDPGFASGNVCLGEMTIGKGASIDGINMADSVIGRYEVGFTNNVAGSLYEYLTAYLITGGTTPSISISSYIAVLAEG